MHRFKRVLIALAMLTASGCSTTPSAKQMQTYSVPASCLAECPAVPAADAVYDWAYTMLGQYAECSVARLQCRAALLEKTNE